MKFGKKGMAESQMFPPSDILSWILFGIVLSITAIIFVIIISEFGSKQAKISEDVELINLMQRFLKSPECFAYNREGNTLYNVIESDKFNEERLSSCYSINDNNFNFPAFKLTLLTSGSLKTIKTKNWNDNREFETKKAPEYVRVHSQDKLQDGKIEIEIQNIQ